jgi:hypothetical protein
MNYWDEPYPSSIKELIKKCESSLENVLNILANANCKTLGVLYIQEKGKLKRQMNEFVKLGYTPNKKLRKSSVDKKS